MGVELGKSLGFPLPTKRFHENWCVKHRQRPWQHARSKGFLPLMGYLGWANQERSSRRGGIHLGLKARAGGNRKDISFIETHSAQIAQV